MLTDDSLNFNISTLWINYAIGADKMYVLISGLNQTGINQKGIRGRAKYSLVLCMKMIIFGLMFIHLFSFDAFQ